MGLAGHEQKRDWKTLSVGPGVDLGREPAARAAKSLVLSPPFAPAAQWCARMTVLSTICTKSLLPTSASISSIRSQSPLVVQRRNACARSLSCQFVRQVTPWRRLSAVRSTRRSELAWGGWHIMARARSSRVQSRERRAALRRGKPPARASMTRSAAEGTTSCTPTRRPTITPTSQPTNVPGSAAHLRLHRRPATRHRRLPLPCRRFRPIPTAGSGRAGRRPPTRAPRRTVTAARSAARKPARNLSSTKGRRGANGFSRQDHYHAPNPDSTGKRDTYLDSEGNPVPDGSRRSHLSPDE